MVNRAIVFAGQGAQYVGMGKDLAESYSECGDLFERANKALGYDLAKICFEGPIETLTKTNHCQPAIFTVSIACWKALAREAPGLEFSATAGLSLGEWSALHMAGAVTFEDALKVLEARGRFMQEACEERKGGMVSVLGLSTEALAAICRETGVAIANLNCPGQVVLSGAQAGIQEAEKRAREMGANRTVRLNVAGAYHCELMGSAAVRLEKALAGVPVRGPSIPVVSNFRGRPHGDPDEIRRDVVSQITGTVRWEAGIRWMKEYGVTEYVECGPGKVLTGLIKRIDNEAMLRTIQDRSSLEQVAREFAGR